MATVPSPNVAQVSGMTPEGASLAQGLAQTELTKNVETFRAGNEQAAQGRQIAASQQQLEQQLKAQRELEEYRGLLEKEKQDKDIAAAKDQLKAQLDEKRRSDTQALEARKVEQDLVLRREKHKARLDLLQQERAAALATEDSAARLKIDQESQAIWDEMTKVDNALARISPRVTNAQDILTKMGEASGSLDSFMAGETQRKKLAVEMTTASVLSSLLNDLPDDDAPLESSEGATPDQQAGEISWWEKPWREVDRLRKKLGFDMPPTSPESSPERSPSGVVPLMGKQKTGARLASYILRLSGRESDPDGKVTGALNRVLSAMESPQDPTKKQDGKAALEELRGLGVESNLIGAAISTMRRGLEHASVNGTISAADLAQATKNPDGTTTSYGTADPERMKKKALKALDIFDRNYVSGGLALGVPVTTDKDAVTTWVDSYLTPLSTTVSKVMEDLRADGVIDDVGLLKELDKYPQARDLLMSKITPLQNALKTEVWQSETDEETKGLFGPKAGAGGIDLNAAKTRVQGLTEKKRGLDTRLNSLKAIGNPQVRRESNENAKKIYDDFLGRQSKEVDALDESAPYRLTP